MTSPAAPWPDSPHGVLARTDALDLGEVAWDEDRVVGYVREVAALAHVPYSRITIVGGPEDLGPWPGDAGDDPWADPAPRRDDWSRYFGRLCGGPLRDVRPLSRAASASGSGSGSGSGSRGRTLWAHSWAQLRSPTLLLSDRASRSSVTRLVAGYVAFMVDRGADPHAPTWSPPTAVREEFGIELRIGGLLVDAYCAGLGTLALVADDSAEGQEIVLARLPALRLLDGVGPDRAGKGRVETDRVDPDDEGPRFHHESGPAVAFADGTGDHFLYGIPFDPWTYGAIVDEVRAGRSDEGPDEGPDDGAARVTEWARELEDYLR